jgi:hypothetical protein
MPRLVGQFILITCMGYPSFATIQTASCIVSGKDSRKGFSRKFRFDKLGFEELWHYKD